MIHEKNGNITVNGDVVILNVREMALAVISLKGTFTGTFQFEGTIDGKNWFALTCTPITGGSTVTSSTIAGQWSVNVAGLINMRVRASASVTGLLEVVMNAIPNGTDEAISSIASLFGELPNMVSKRMTFAGATTNDPGDFDGTGNPATLLTVTGDVELIVFGICKTDLAGANATLEVGVASGTAQLIAQTTATSIDAKMAWNDATPGLTQAKQTSPVIVGVSQNVIQTVGTANITTGVIDYYCFWRPLSTDGNVVAA